jgi:aminoglycoside phosphotransferase (APT) family kinase protein
MHADEIDIPESLVRKLIRVQFGQWAHLPLDRVRSGGTDHAMFRLGDKMVTRLPRIPGVVGQVEKEQHWLPLLAPHLPLSIPTPVAKGHPGEDYSWPWSIYRWLEGDTPAPELVEHSQQTARELAGFIMALQKIDTAGAPLPGDHNFLRGVPLVVRDEQTLQAIAQLDGLFDTQALGRAWNDALQAREFTGKPVWIHGDLSCGNLLMSKGRISAVIDFGGMAVADPACDVMAAWSIFDGDARTKFRESLTVDEETWRRGRGWALSTAAIALPYYLKTNPTMVDTATRTLAQVLSDFGKT